MENLDELKTILIQTAHNLKRMRQDSAIGEKVCRILKKRNDIALEQLECERAKANNKERVLPISGVSKILVRDRKLKPTVLLENY